MKLWVKGGITTYFDLIEMPEVLTERLKDDIQQDYKRYREGRGETWERCSYYVDVRGWWLEQTWLNIDKTWRRLLYHYRWLIARESYHNTTPPLPLLVSPCLAWIWTIECSWILIFVRYNFGLVNINLIITFIGTKCFIFINMKYCRIISNEMKGLNVFHILP